MLASSDDGQDGKRLSATKKVRRANPEKRKKAKEDREFPEGIDMPVSDGKMFNNMTDEAMQRLTAMLTNFLEADDGALRKEVDLRQYGIDSGQNVTNATVQELCKIQPDLVSLNLAGCTMISDVGLWALARHCTTIRSLNLAGCNQITAIGLRSISLRCSNVVSLNFNNCHLLDDIALTIIATGAWHIENIYLRNCTGITDTGLGKLAKASERLTTLDLNGCTSVGEYGDHALKEIGAFCNKLSYFDFSGCKHVEDAGLRAVAVGCTNLTTLHISGCDNISEKSIKELCRHSRHLSTLSLIGCRRLPDAALEALHNSALQQSLTALDLSGCSKITDRGVGAIGHALGGKLLSLGISGAHVTDFASVILSKLCLNLRSLDLSRCHSITDASVHTLAQNVSGLTSLKLDGNDRVTMKAIYSHVGKTLEFADLAKRWLGYQPKENSSQLIAAREIFRLHTKHTLRLQCAIRRKFAYNRYRERRRWWLIIHVIPRAQALVRRYLQRKRYKGVLFLRYKVRMAILIQTVYRMHVEVKRKIAKLKHNRFMEYKQRMAIRIQKMYWGLVGRKRALAQRNKLANERISQAAEQMRRELMANKIQMVYHGWKARVEACDRAEKRRLYIERKAMEERMIRLIQRIAHGKLGRNKAKRRRAEIALALLRWKSAREIQRIYRGLLGRRRFAYFLKLWLEKVRHAAANNIQRIWRGYRGRILAAIAKALRQFRAEQMVAAREVQRAYRGYLARRRVLKIRDARRLAIRHRIAAIKIQKLYRGHKGREAAELESQVAKMEGLARPLFDLLKTKEAEAIKLGKLITRLENKDKLMTDDIFEIEREYETALTTTAKYTDSARINGVPQRFLTKYIRVRLKDHLEHEKELHKAKFTDLQRRRAEMRKLQAEIVAARRELLPLTVGLVSDSKRNRTKRLRDKVRAQKRAATLMQALWRGALTRWAAMDPHMESWVQCYDEDQGEKVYYFNTMSEETAWKMPPAFKYFHAWKYEDRPWVKKGADRKTSTKFNMDND